MLRINPFYKVYCSIKMIVILKHNTSKQRSCELKNWPQRIKIRPISLSPLSCHKPNSKYTKHALYQNDGIIDPGLQPLSLHP